MKGSAANTPANQTMAGGFVLLLSGILVVSAQEDNTLLQVVGVILIIAASALFGLSISRRNAQRK